MQFTTRRLCYILLAIALSLPLIRPIEDPDMWWHLRNGQYILTTFRVPRTDTYSFTNLGKPWFAPEWLSEAAMYGVYYLSGPVGLLVIFALISAGVFFFMARCTEARRLRLDRLDADRASITAFSRALFEVRA